MGPPYPFDESDWYENRGLALAREIRTASFGPARTNRCCHQSPTIREYSFQKYQPNGARSKISSKSRTMSRRPTTPLGAYPQSRLCGHVGKPPRSKRIKMIIKSRPMISSFRCLHGADKFV